MSTATATGRHAAPRLLLLVAALLGLAAGPGLAQDPAALRGGEFDCLMDAAQRVRIGASVTGLIRAVHVERGDVVRRGQPLAQLASEVEEANAALARVDAQMNLEAAQAELLRTEEQVAQRRILSPLDGIVVERLLGAGEYMHEQAQLLTLAQIDPIHVEVYLPVSYFGQVAPGDEAVVMPEAPVGGMHRARVSVVDRVMDAASGTFGVRLLLPNPELRLPAGLRCRLSFGSPR